MKKTVNGYVGLVLTPDEDLPLGPYTGNITLTDDSVSSPVGFIFTAVSDKTGGLKVLAEDEFTYFADTHPLISGAAVRIKNSYDGTVVGEGVTDQNGEFVLNNIIEGVYSLEVSVEKHGTYNGNVQIIPGETIEVKAFLPRQLVSYSWQVIPVQTDDHYVVNLEAVFETHVPAPVITVEPSMLDVSQLAYDDNGTAHVNYTLTNHGLISANGASINFGVHPDYLVTPLNGSIGEIPAMTTLVVPVTIKKLNQSTALLQNSLSKSHGLDPQKSLATVNVCALSVDVDYYYVCNDRRWQKIKVLIITGTCLPVEIPDVFTELSKWVPDDGFYYVCKDGICPPPHQPDIKVESCCSAPFPDDFEDCSRREPNPAFTVGEGNNGCGNGGLLNIALCAPIITPELISLPACAVFYTACDAHDTCYGTCNSFKDQCDANFWVDMLTACDAYYPINPLSRLSCYNMARTFYEAVSHMGKDAFDDAQKERCCCVEMGGAQ